MARTAPVSLAARERLREHQAAAARAVTAHAAATARLDTAVARRAEVIAAQDALVAAATDEVTATVGGAVRVMGVDVAAAVLGVPKAEARRAATDAR